MSKCVLKGLSPFFPLQIHFDEARQEYLTKIKNRMPASLRGLVIQGAVQYKDAIKACLVGEFAPY